MESKKLLEELLEEFLEARKRWCIPKEIDDAEEMWDTMPSLIDKSVYTLEKVLGVPSSMLVINTALYGEGNVLVDVTEHLLKGAHGDHLEILVGNEILGGDPCPGRIKTLTVTYSYRGETSCASARERETLKIN